MDISRKTSIKKQAGVVVLDLKFTYYPLLLLAKGFTLFLYLHPASHVFLP